MGNKSLMDWQKEVHKLSVAKGWHDRVRSPLEIHALISSEVGEATNEVRKDVPELYQNKNKLDNDEYDPKLKPEGEAVELADAVIRIMDYFESKGWDLGHIMELKHDYNKLRSYRHGGKKY